MSFAPSHRDERLLDLDITPMIDVVFLLIIFFMTTAQFARLSKARLDLPKEAGEHETASEDTGLVVNIKSDGEIITDRRSVTLARLIDMVGVEIANAGGDASSLELWIRADQGAPASVLNQIATELRTMGVRSWRLATQVPTTGAGDKGPGS